MLVRVRAGLTTQQPEFRYDLFKGNVNYYLYTYIIPQICLIIYSQNKGIYRSPIPPKLEKEQVLFQCYGC